jgi:hypothetical protein
MNLESAHVLYGHYAMIFDGHIDSPVVELESRGEALAVALHNPNRAIVLSG